jgi:hypothetical protein
MRIAFVEQFLERLGNRTGTNLHDRRADADWFVNTVD